MQTAANLTGIKKGSYTVKVTDSNGCEKSETFVITEPTQLVINEVVSNRKNILCFGEATGTISVEGTGGTKPFCHPSTLNIDSNTSNSDYCWVKNDKKNDIWSVSFIFACILIFRKCYTNYNNFPSDFFDENKYVNINYLNYIPKQYRTAFILSLSKNDNSCNNDDTTLDIQSFILLLERGLNL